MLAQSSIFWVFGMTRPEIESLSSGPLANTLTIKCYFLPQNVPPQ